METLKNNSKASFKDLYQARFVIRQFAIRDIKARYVNTSLGYLWSVLNPLFNFIIYVTAFGVIIKVSTPEYNVDYYVILLCGIVVWSYFNQAADSVSNVLIYNENLINKVYFPRMALVISAVSVASMDFLISLLILVIIFYFDGTLESENIIRLIFIPILWLGLLLIAIGFGSIMAILKMKFKDFRHIMPMLFQAWFFLSPIVYTLALVPDSYKLIYGLNPFVGYIELCRWIFISNAQIEIANISYSMCSSLLLAIAGLHFFNSNERKVVEKV